MRNKIDISGSKHFQTTLCPLQTEDVFFWVGGVCFSKQNVQTNSLSLQKAPLVTSTSPATQSDMRSSNYPYSLSIHEITPVDSEGWEAELSIDFEYIMSWLDRLTEKGGKLAEQESPVGWIGAQLVSVLSVVQRRFLCKYFGIVNNSMFLLCFRHSFDSASFCIFLLSQIQLLCFWVLAMMAASVGAPNGGCVLCFSVVETLAANGRKTNWFVWTLTFPFNVSHTSRSAASSPHGTRNA